MVQIEDRADGQGDLARHFFLRPRHLHGKLFIVPDATKDARFKNNPLVIGVRKIRFYAGAPLTTPAGHRLGTLCVLDRKPRQLGPEQKRAMQILARHMMSLLEMRRRIHELGGAAK